MGRPCRGTDTDETDAEEAGGLWGGLGGARLHDVGERPVVDRMARPGGVADEHREGGKYRVV